MTLRCATVPDLERTGIAPISGGLGYPSYRPPEDLDVGGDDEDGILSRSMRPAQERRIRKCRWQIPILICCEIHSSIPTCQKWMGQGCARSRV